MRRGGPPMLPIDPASAPPFARVERGPRGLRFAPVPAPAGAAAAPGPSLRVRAAAPAALRQAAVVAEGKLVLGAGAGVAYSLLAPKMQVVHDRRPPGLDRVIGAAGANAGLLHGDDGWRGVVLPSLGDLAAGLGEGPVAIRADGRRYAVAHESGVDEYDVGIAAAVAFHTGPPVALCYAADASLVVASGSRVGPPGVAAGAGAPIVELAAATAVPRVAARHADGTISIWEVGRDEPLAGWASPVRRGGVDRPVRRRRPGRPRHAGRRRARRRARLRPRGRAGPQDRGGAPDRAGPGARDPPGRGRLGKRMAGTTGGGLMSTKPLGPPPILADDPGPWSVVSSVFAQAGRPGRRRPLPPMGLMLSPPPDTHLMLEGLESSSPVAGVGPVRVVAAAREPAFTLSFDPAAGVLRGVSPFVLRAWSIPDLALQAEERPGEDPAAELPPPVSPESLHEADLPIVAAAPGGGVVAVHSKEGRNDVIALIRVEEGTVVRWIRAARAAAWSDDGRFIAVAGPWGVLLAETTVSSS